MRESLKLGWRRKKKEKVRKTERRRAANDTCSNFEPSLQKEKNCYNCKVKKEKLTKIVGILKLGYLKFCCKRTKLVSLIYIYIYIYYCKSSKLHVALPLSCGQVLKMSLVGNIK